MARRPAPDAIHPRHDRAGDRGAHGLQPAGEGPRGAQLQDPPRSLGQRVAVARHRALPAHNARYAQEAANSTVRIAPCCGRTTLARILCVRIERTLRADWTLRCRNQWFQLLPQQPVALRPKDKLVMEFRLDGSIQLRAKGHTLASTPLAQAPARRDRYTRGLGDAAAQSDAHTWPRNDDRPKGQGYGYPWARPTGAVCKGPSPHATMQAGKTGTDSSMAHTMLGRFTSQTYNVTAADMKFLQTCNTVVVSLVQQRSMGYTDVRRLPRRRLFFSH